MDRRSPHGGRRPHGCSVKDIDVKLFLMAAFDREAERSKRVLQHVPAEDYYVWRPNDRAMYFGYVAELVATIPTWIALQLTGDELDIMPEGGSSMTRESHRTRDALLHALESSVTNAREAFASTSDEQLQTEWRLKARGTVVQADTRGAMIQDTLLHWAHHRGQLTVYLRLVGASIPALYGPSGDDRSFGPGSVPGTERPPAD